MIPFTPTKRGFALILVAFVSLFISLTNPNLAATIVSSGLFSIVGSGIIFSLMSIRKIHISRSPGTDCCAGEIISLPLSIENKSRFTRQAFVIREEFLFKENTHHNETVSPLAGFESRVVSREIYAEKRGKYNLDKIYLIGGDPAGLFRRVISFRAKEAIAIYPETENVNWMSLTVKKKVHVSSVKPIGVSGLGQDFFGVREYRHSDSMRFIHWKASAKHRKLMVREFEAFGMSSVGILLDTDRKHAVRGYAGSAFEQLIKVASSAVSYVSATNCSIFFSAFDGENGEIRNMQGSGSRVRLDIMDMLSEIKPSGKTALDMLDLSVEAVPRDSILYLLSLSESPDFFPYFDSLISRGVEIRWIYAPHKNFMYRERVPVRGEKDMKCRSMLIPTMILEPGSKIGAVLGYV